MPQLIDGLPISDFRSDTVTRPTPEMRRAMAEAVVGDDVFGDDPTVNALEEEVAALFGKEAALFTPSGTMANLVALMTHCRHGDEVFVEEYSHTYNNEVGSAGAIAGVVTRTFASDRGRLDPARVERFARAGDLHQPGTRLLVVEQTHNFHGGRVVPLETLRALKDVCERRGMALHVDGARIFNAVVASGLAPAAYGEVCDSLQLCFSKGLGAPVGSALLGRRDFVAQARRMRKRLGGGMRQAGVLAAAAQLALRDGPRQMVTDHEHARALAAGAAEIAGAVIDPADVETNILFLKTTDGRASYGPIAQGLAERGVLAIPIDDLGIRFVTHRDVDAEDVARALAALRELIPAHCGAAA
ncbi:MAG: low specificity L-threonine aldolase [Planctomycetota bacterium]